MEIPIVPLACHVQQGIVRDRTQQSQRLSVATVESLGVQTNAAVLGRCNAGALRTLGDRAPRGNTGPSQIPEVPRLELDLIR